MKRPFPVEKPPVSALIITLNEEKNIKDCLDSLDWVKEIVVVDAESTDKTHEICSRKNHVRWLQKKWAGFAPQKNFGIDQTGEEWVLILDADERVTDDLRDEIMSVISFGDDLAGFEIPRKNYYYGKWLQHGGIYPDYQLRLFKRKLGKYDDSPVHERFILIGDKGFLKSPLDHYTERMISDHFKKFDQYTTLAAEDLYRQGRVSTVIKIMLNPFLTFIKLYILKKGILDGIHGFIYAIFASAYTFIKYAKLWELRKK